MKETVFISIGHILNKTIVHVNDDASSSKDTQTNANLYSLPLRVRTLRATIYVLSKALNLAYVPLFIYRIFERRKRCTPVTDPILKMPAVELAKKIRRKEMSCLHVVEAYICRIKEVNPLLNAVIEDRFAEALEDAKKVDELVSRKDFLENEEAVAKEYPLLGVPITIKGSLAVKGMKYTSGTRTRKDVRAEIDADAVALARAAGAIPLLVSNVPELCMSWETSNKLIGTTKNPHDTRRTCGGSSGGEASLLGAGASVLGIGSDVAGSLRLPAHYCGVWGHKPTPRAVSFEGHYPDSRSRDVWEEIFTVGPMARYATDLPTLLQVIAKPEKREMLNLNEKINIKDIKIYYSEFEDFYWQKPNSHCREAVTKVVDHFSKICNTKPQKIDFFLKQNLPDMIACDILTTKDIDDEFDGNANGAFKELFKYAAFQSDHTFMLIMCGILRRLATTFSGKRKPHIDEIIGKVKKLYEGILKDNGVIIVPTFPVEAPRHGDVLRVALSSGCLSLFNGLGYPVTNCPAGATKSGIPIGIQVASLPYGDKLTLAVAQEIERSFGGWIEP
ncbi:unnamed protein product [Ceutorhynchus assimilis]|uniref:Amidase domain-containing protein n=1 Tax=Ceutorhynchus assimilis TaxID=467358 RepID=A0A9P0DP46_9CUCU|nr:unnamed protein product [Ceutorhynchus assimilis]